MTVSRGDRLVFSVLLLSVRRIVHVVLRSSFSLHRILQDRVSSVHWVEQRIASLSPLLEHVFIYVDQRRTAWILVAHIPSWICSTNLCSVGSCLTWLCPLLLPQRDFLFRLLAPEDSREKQMVSQDSPHTDQCSFLSTYDQWYRSRHLAFDLRYPNRLHPST